MHTYGGKLLRGPYSWLITLPMLGNTSAGLGTLVAELAAAGVAEVAIERPDGPVVTALLDAGLTVVVISPMNGTAWW